MYKETDDKEYLNSLQRVRVKPYCTHIGLIPGEYARVGKVYDSGRMILVLEIDGERRYVGPEDVEEVP